MKVGRTVEEMIQMYLSGNDHALPYIDSQWTTEGSVCIDPDADGAEFWSDEPGGTNLMFGGSLECLDGQDGVSRICFFSVFLINKLVISEIRYNVNFAHR